MDDLTSFATEKCGSGKVLLKILELLSWYVIRQKFCRCISAKRWNSFTFENEFLPADAVQERIFKFSLEEIMTNRQIDKIFLADPLLDRGDKQFFLTVTNSIREPSQKEFILI